jgi:hypothetical protein
MIDTITVASVVGVSASGDPTYGLSFTLKARVEENYGIVATADGEQSTYTHKVATEIEIGRNARVWLPGASTGDNNAAMRPLASKTAQTLSGGYRYYLTFF